MRLIFTILLIIVSTSANSQIKFDTSKTYLNSMNNKDCSNFEYQSSLPVFNSESDCITALNDSIYSICKQGFDEMYYTRFPDVKALFSNDTCDQNDPTTIAIKFNIFCNADSLLSFYLEFERAAGQGGHATQHSVFAFNLNPRDGCFINWKSQLDNTFLTKSISIINNKIKEDGFNFSSLSIDDIENVCLSQDTVRFFYILESGSHQWTDYIDIPLKKLKPNIQKRHFH